MVSTAVLAAELRAMVQRNARIIKGAIVVYGIATLVVLGWGLFVLFG